MSAVIAGLVAMLVLVIATMIGELRNDNAVAIPPMPTYAPAVMEDHDDYEWSAYYAEAYDEYADEFTALFNSYETKRARNGAMLIRSTNGGSYRFARKA